jgi:wyosine [tRNA(Phe)-imidazoG37] synthetase (radical SAM superfamily)
MFEIDRAVIEINGGCNYTCKMCPQTNLNGTTGARGKTWLKKMPLSMFEDVVAQCSDLGLNIVNLDGSGEATLNSNLPRYIEIVKKYSAQAYIFSNGYNMNGQFMKDCVDAGLSFFRFSIIGYNTNIYKQWMNNNNFDKVVNNLKEMRQYVIKSKSRTEIATYHLILDNTNIDYEIEQYLKIVNSADVGTEIWKMHNWSGVYDSNYIRSGETKTCGRPFSPDIVIRAGGNNGKTGAVHPCCQVLGNDSEAVLGHTSDTSIKDIIAGKLYEKLREQHRTSQYPEYCKKCDFLIDDPETLVYTNNGRSKMHMNGTKFSLNDYR